MSSMPHVTPQQKRNLVHGIARGLGWFSLVLGAAELIRPRATARATGLQGREPLLQAYGAREIAAGVGLLAARDPTPWLWARVAGDALDIATLSTQAKSVRRLNVGLSLAAVVGVTLLDVIAASSLQAETARRRRPVFDYSDRSGFPNGQPKIAATASIETA